MRKGSEVSITLPTIPRRRDPEVLAPAGNLRVLKTAVDFGADAVYCGGAEFGMRAAPKNFTLEDFAEGIRYAHERGARVYATVNIIPGNSEVEGMNAYMGSLAEIGVDALIVTDIGMLMEAKRIAPRTELHISTQAGVMNYQAATALYELGAKRVVLAREVSLDEIREMRSRVPADLEIEAFVHGSMCMAFSGRCLISKYTTGRDANHGDCAQSCRWKYHVVEEKRPGEFFPVEVTEGGTFLFNSQDLKMLEHVDDVIEAGVTSLKIEGRAKGQYYVAALTNAYKTAVSTYLTQKENAAGEAIEGEFRLPQWLGEEPYKVTHREYSTGFFYPENPAEESITRGGYINEWMWLGTVTSYDMETKRLGLLSRNKITPGTVLEFLIPGQEPVVWELLVGGIRDEAGNPVMEINHPAHEFTVPCEIPVPPGAMIRAQGDIGARR